ncbi:MAG TPA: hypothetical protein PK842_11600 [Smithella sp.]|jgi:vacuolar-type H+-ATPase subunit E/Vma4|nr:hypothetical protein [Smithella sp.]HOO35488.1 hypothetical protein [Smithella sp.]HPC09041.1 hypothetical protein [Smithella sp.]HPK23420.1 hypothetical protein [Smithella sp.]HPR16109.1 hypothetical protein [Smithella sp.]
MDNTTLENSIREEASRAITAIREKEALEMRQMDEVFSMEMEDFRRQAEAETESHIRQEISKLENKALLERKKMKLQNAEQFINRIVDEVMKNIRNDRLYKQFLLEAIRDGVKISGADVDIKLSNEDIFLKKDIVAAIAAMDGRKKVSITEDSKVQWGGCLIRDKETGRIFNHTLERIYFRKSLLIRQQVMSLLMRKAEGNQ